MKTIHLILGVAVCTIIIHTMTLSRLELPAAYEAGMAATVGPADPWADALDYIHWRESRQGQALNGKVVGPCGEMGEYQQTPIFRADIERLTGRTYDPRRPRSARWAARVWLMHYAPLAGLTPDDGEELAKLYRYGYAGYMELQGELR